MKYALTVAYRLLAVVTALLIPLAAGTGCGSRSAYNPGLSDLGGVYASNDRDL